MRQVILASASPRRSQLLGQMGLTFRVVPADADETLPSGMPPAQAVTLLAQRKAELVAAGQPDALVIAADTVVAVEGDILGKPADREEAAAMLRCLSGRQHEVLTGLCLAVDGRIHTAAERTLVCFDPWSEVDIASYVASGEPMDKAGAYGIQGLAGMFVSGIEGCYYNVMGLPLSALRRLLIGALGENEFRQLAPWPGGPGGEVQLWRS